MKTLFNDENKVIETLGKFNLNSWASMRNIAQSRKPSEDQGFVINVGEMPPTHYKAADLYKRLKTADWGHPAVRAASMPVAVHLEVGLNSGCGTIAIDQLAVSVSSRSLKKAQLRGLEKLGQEMLKRLQEQGLPSEQLQKAS